MASGFAHTCTVCGYSVETSGPHEFYRDAEGRRRYYGHPDPVSEEAVRSGIHGFSAEVYCPLCDRIFDVVLVEFVRPTHDLLAAWAGDVDPRAEFLREDAAKCPNCGGTQLLLDPEEGTEPQCPRCGRGRLVGRQKWIS